MEPEKTDQNPNQNPNPNQDQDQLVKEAQAAAEQASETTEQIEEQHAEETKQPQAAPTENSTTPESSQPLVVPDSIVAPVKKKHTARKVILTILILLILGCAGVAIWFFAYYNNTEKVVGDALQNFVKAENISTTTNFQQTREDPSLTVDANILANRHLPIGLSAQATIASGDHEQNISASLEIDTDGVIYANVSGLPELLGITPESRKTAESLGGQFSTIINLIDEVDSETWRVYIPEIVTELGLDKKTATTITEAYTCSINNIKNNDAVIDTVISTYTANPFFNIKNSADNSLFNNTYDLTIDATKLTNFINTLAQSDAVTQSQDCFKDLSSESTETTSVNEATIEAYVGELPPITVKIDWLSHQLQKVSTTSNDGSASFKSTITYPTTTNVKMPEEYRSVTELLDQFTDIVNIYAPSGLSASGNLEVTEVTGSAEA